MFEKLSIARGVAGLALLADALPYYGHLDLSLDAPGLATLAKEFGPEPLLDIVDAKILTLLFSNGQYGVRTENSGVPLYSFGLITLVRRSEGQELRTAQDRIEMAFDRILGPNTHTKKTAKLFSDRIVERPAYVDVSKLAFSELSDSTLRDPAVDVICSELIPGFFAQSPRLSIVSAENDKFYASMAINYDAATKALRRHTGDTASKFETVSVLHQWLTAREHFSFAAERDSDLAIPPLSQKIIACRVNGVLRRLQRSKEIECFQYATLGGKSFSAALARGEKTTSDLVDFLLGSESLKFRDWAKTLGSNASLIEEYVRANSSRGALDLVPAKLLKVAVFTGAGLAMESVLPAGGVVAAASAAVGAFDEFVLSKLRLGWRPSGWISEARDFIGGE